MSNNVVQLPDTNKMKEQGSLWLAKLDRGLSKDEEVLLKAWLAESTDNRNYFITLAKQWDQLSVLSELADVIPYESKVAKKRWSTYATAASFALVFLLGAVFYNATNMSLFSQETVAAKKMFSESYRTSVGEKSTVYLPDSSILTLNTDSLVKVNFSDNRRLITLEKGEAHIKVAHNKERKLILSAGEKSFVAVGTAFNVQYDNESLVELIVTEGKVGITDIEQIDQVDSLFSNTNESNSLIVNAGERVIIEPASHSLANELRKENIQHKLADSLAWREGKLVFRGETLEQVITEMSRYSDIQFEFKDDNIKAIRIGGRFRTGDIDGFLDILSQQFDIKSSRLSKSRIQLLPNNS